MSRSPTAAPTQAFSSAVEAGKTAVAWSVRTIPRCARRSASSAVTSSPSKTTRPASGGREPARSRSAVVLPEPFGPTTATTRPVGSSSDMPSSAVKPSKRLARPVASRTGVDSAAGSGGGTAPGPARPGAGTREQPPPQLRQQALAAEAEDDEDEHRRDHRVEACGFGALGGAHQVAHLGHEEIDAEADGRAERRPRAAEQDGDEELEREERPERVQVGDAGEVDREGPGQAAHRGRADERREPQPADRGSERRGRGGALGRRREPDPVRRSRQRHECQCRERQQRQGELVVPDGAETVLEHESL